METDKCIDLLSSALVSGKISELEAERFLNAAARLKAGVPTGGRIKSQKNID